MPDELEAIINRMVDAGESDDDIKFVIDEYRKTGGPRGLPMDPAAREAARQANMAAQANVTSDPDQAYRDSLVDTAKRTLTGIGRGVLSAVDPRTYIGMAGAARDLMVPTYPGAEQRTRERIGGLVSTVKNVASGDPDAGGEMIGQLATGMALPRILPKVPNAMVRTGEALETAGQSNFAKRAAHAAGTATAVGAGIGGHVGEAILGGAAAEMVPPAMAGTGRLLQRGGTALGGTPKGMSIPMAAGYDRYMPNRSAQPRTPPPLEQAQIELQQSMGRTPTPPGEALPGVQSAQSLVDDVLMRNSDYTTPSPDAPSTVGSEQPYGNGYRVPYPPEAAPAMPPPPNAGGRLTPPPPRVEPATPLPNSVELPPPRTMTKAGQPSLTSEEVAAWAANPDAYAPGRTVGPPDEFYATRPAAPAAETPASAPTPPTTPPSAPASVADVAPAVEESALVQSELQRQLEDALAQSGLKVSDVANPSRSRATKGSRGSGPSATKGYSRADLESIGLDPDVPLTRPLSAREIATMNAARALRHEQYYGDAVSEAALKRSQNRGKP